MAPILKKQSSGGSRQRMHFSFRATLFSLMLAVLLTAVVMLGTAAFLFSRYAARNLGDQVLGQAEKRVEQQLRHSLDLAEAEAESVASLFAQEWLDPRRHEQVTEYFLTSLKARPSLSYLSFGMPDGTYYHAYRDDDGGLSALWLLPQEDGTRRLHEFKVREDGERVTVNDIADSKRTPPYDRPYYQGAREAGTALWTETYVFLGSGESLDVPGVSRAVPVYSSEDQLLGVLTADFDLFALSHFLREVNLGKGGLCFLVEVSGDGQPRVIAHPGAAEPDPQARLDLTKASAEGEGRTTVSPDQVADPRVATFVSSLGQQITEVLPTLHTIKIDVEGSKYAGAFRHLGRESGPDWVICMLLPDDEVFGDVHRMARLMGVLGLVGVLVAGILSLVLSRRVASSLGTIADETRSISQFRLDSKDLVPSRISEIGTLSTAIEEMKTGLRSFQKYVPEELVRSLLETGQEAELGGSRKELTVYFSDIVGFTSISEQLAPEQLVEMLSEYLDEMTVEILRRGGTVDKYIGDAIMAFWGAPQVHPSPVISACRGALQNQARLKELREGWERAGLPGLRARIGLHTGEATVGNFGSPRRLDYTAIGDTVNVASRLEGLNRIYGTEILISETSRLAVSEEMFTRPIDRVAVKGREEGILIHELLAETGSTSEAMIAWRDGYARALELYFKGEWRAAMDGFELVLEQRSGDPASALMRDRCGQLLAMPPDKGWDGVYRAEK